MRVSVQEWPVWLEGGEGNIWMMFRRRRRKQEDGAKKKMKVEDTESRGKEWREMWGENGMRWVKEERKCKKDGEGLLEKESRMEREWESNGERQGHFREWSDKLPKHMDSQAGVQHEDTTTPMLKVQGRCKERQWLGSKIQEFLINEASGDSALSQCSFCLVFFPLAG